MLRAENLLSPGHTRGTSFRVSMKELSYEESSHYAYRIGSSCRTGIRDNGRSQRRHSRSWSERFGRCRRRPEGRGRACSRHLNRCRWHCDPHQRSRLQRYERIARCARIHHFRFARWHCNTQRRCRDQRCARQRIVTGQLHPQRRWNRQRIALDQCDQRRHREQLLGVHHAQRWGGKPHRDVHQCFGRNNRLPLIASTTAGAFSDLEVSPPGMARRSPPDEIPKRRVMPSFPMDPAQCLSLV